jgi:hypothetical protein
MVRSGLYASLVISYVLITTSDLFGQGDTLKQFTSVLCQVVKADSVPFGFSINSTEFDFVAQRGMSETKRYPHFSANFSKDSVLTSLSYFDSKRNVPLYRLFANHFSDVVVFTCEVRNRDQLLPASFVLVFFRRSENFYLVNFSHKISFSSGRGRLNSPIFCGLDERSICSIFVLDRQLEPKRLFRFENGRLLFSTAFFKEKRGFYEVVSLYRHEDIWLIGENTDLHEFDKSLFEKQYILFRVTNQYYDYDFDKSNAIWILGGTHKYY